MPLSPELEEKTVKLLMKIRGFEDESIESKSGRKQFLRSLKESYLRDKAMMQLLSQQTKEKMNNGVKKGEDSFINAEGEQQSVIPSSNSTGKVRLELVEAVQLNQNNEKLSSSSKSSKKAGKKSKSGKSNDNAQDKKKSSSNPIQLWKVGDKRKTVVLPRSTSIEKLLKLAKAKLNMKKAVRSFCVRDIQDKADKKKRKDNDASLIEVNLTTDISGLDDGDIVYIASFQNENNLQNNTNTDGPDELSSIQKALEKVKLAYEKRNNRKEGSTSIQTQNLTLGELSSVELPPITESRSHLPICDYRSEILRALDDTQVTVICGSTGCGKVS